MCIIVHSRGHGKRAQLSSLLMLTCGLPPSEQLITDPITDKLDLAHYREVFRLYVLSLVLGSSFNPLTSGTHPHVWFRHMHATLRSEPVHGMALQLEIFAWAVLTFYVYTISADNEGVCVPSTAAAAAEGRGCGRKRCAADSDCRGRNKRCLCDGPCGMSCVNPNGTCREPQAPSNGAVEVDQLWFGGLAVYSCDDGHVLSGQAQRQCTGDREWSWQTPECMKNVTTCGEPPDVDHAMYDGERRRVSFDVGERLLYRCNSGFFRIGQPYVRCGENGQWSAVQLTCKARSCGNPGELANGRRDGLLFTYPNRVQYRCNQGYTLVGRPVRVCLSTQQWSGSLPRCQPVSCPVLQHPENGHRFGTDVTYNKVVKFTCSTGYIVRGSAERTCGADGTWSGEEASCAVINCGEPDPVWNGFWEGSDYGHRAEVSFSCRRGFLHVGAMSAVCQDDETWSSPSPHCFGKCEIERPPSNGYFSSRVYNGQLLSHGDTVEVACDTGYQLDGDRVVTCDNGTLALPTCNPRPCDDVPVLVNGEVDVTGLAHGSRATFRCVRGFRLDGPSQTTCYLGTWQTLSSCKHILCPQLDEIVDDAQIRLLRDGSYESFFQKDDLTQGAEVLISCTAGTTLQGSRKAECDNGLWVYRGGQGQPFCSPDPCPVNGVNIQSDHPDEVGHAERVTFRCAEGFEAEPGQTQTTLTCERGQWTPHSPTCTEAWCPLPKKIDHGAFRPDVQFVASGGDIELVCDVNYAPSRQSGKTRCRQGRWSTQLPTCLYHPEPCVLPDLPHGTYLGNIQAGNRLSHQETVTYRCSQGPSQDMTAQCYEGNWRSQPPHCSQGCKSGYTFFHHGCYKISSDTKSHGEARDSCRRDGAELVAVRTQAVHDFLVRRLHAAQYWIGLRDSAREGSWLYADGSPLGNFNMWGDGQPSGNWWYDEDCVAMHKPDSYRWHDFYCSKKYRYICQYTILTVTCPDPGIPAGSRRSGSSYYVDKFIMNEHVTYSCQEGFLLQGAPDIWCRWDGTWSDTPPTCAAMVSCPVPAVPDNGEMRGRTFSVDSTVSFSCRPGFTLSGPREITCLTDGQWSDNFPTCNVISYECAVPELSENVVNTSPKASYNVGDTIIFTCRPNFVLSGEETLRCMADLTWSADPPQCQADADEATSRPRPRTLCGDRVCDVWEKCDNKTSSHWRCICIRPQDCPRGGMRVCSKDGTVFENRCRLMAADCLPNYSFQFSHITEDGECTADEAQGASGDAASSTGRGAQPGGRAGVAFDPVQTTPADVELTTFSETEEIFSDLRIPDMNGQR
ncbi:CSMD1 [Branchiostoma lanceolatum]|uniref:CSMD1 protein n=1 Tax=Branchiostoma lanceolatum TaxID=7740 RepID=A0A8K0F1W0_BRALA|nr:CSMD1 [Branchiostoma lanceolatum]